MPIELTTVERRFFRDQLREAYGEPLLDIARRGPAAPLPGDDRGSFMPLDILFSAVKNGRNDAVHQGAHARHLVTHCVQFALLVEEGLMADSKCVADFMVREPACAEPWQQVDLARQRMLANSFSHLPIRINDEWMLLSDHAIALYKATAKNPPQAMRERIEVVSARGALVLTCAFVVDPLSSVEDAVKACDRGPILVVQDGRLLGIATAFDFL